MMVASFLMTATRAMLAPRLRLMRLNHSRSSGVLSQHLMNHLCQQPPGHGAASFGDASEALVLFAAISTAGGESPIIGKAVGTRETLYPTNTTC